jgi:Fic family protein
MMSFRDGRLAKLALSQGTVWLLTDIAEAKGRHELYAKQAPQLLKALREAALIQSVESSNRIEGVTVPPGRLRPLVVGNATPQDRSEQDIHGYRQALQLIHTSWRDLPITPQTLQRLHRLALQGAGDAGQWKRVENEIVEFRQGATPIVRFRPVSVADTPAAIDELCLSYRHAVTQADVAEVVTVAALVLDFLCVHPLRDGNGRVARLLSLLALYHHGHEVGRYISLERLIEESKDDYYETLRRSSEHWHAGQHDILPWLNYFAAVIRRAYREFEHRAGDVKTPRGAKTALVTAAIDAFPGDFTLTDIERACPGVSRDMVRRVLMGLRRLGKVACLGRGPGAAWRKKG